MTITVMDHIMAKHVMAHKHLETLSRETKAFLKRASHRIEIEANADSTEFIFRTQDVKPVPIEISLITGDVVHNARSVLDHLAYALARKPNRSTSFPICKSPKSPGDAPITIAGGITKQVETIIELVQPYHGGNNKLLAILNDLDIMDKHKLLLPTVNSFNASSHGIEGLEDGQATLTYTWGELHDGAEVARVIYITPKLAFNPQFSIVPCLALTGTPVQGDDFLTLLWNILQHVATTAHTFSSFV